MPSRGTSAGSVRLDGVSPADWQANDSGLSGDWSDPTHWSTGAEPDITTDVEIAGDASVTAPWTVSVASGAAATLTLDMNAGELDITGDFSVAGALTQASGTLNGELGGASGGAFIEVGSLEQVGGAVSLDGCTLLSSGVDAVNGVVLLFDGATWQDAGLSIGFGLDGSAGPLSSSVTLEAGPSVAAGSTLDDFGDLTVGGDPDPGSAGGVGSLELDGGSALVATGTLGVFDGSTITLDSESDIAIAGAAGVAGAVAVGAGGLVVADIGGIGGDLLSAGTLDVVDFAGDGVSAAGTLSITGSLDSSGDVAVTGGSQLYTGGSIEIDAGTLTADVGSEISAASFYFAGGAVSVDGGTLSSDGPDFVNTTTTLSDAASWVTGSLALAPGVVSGDEVTANLALIGASVLTDTGGLNVGNDPGTGGDTSQGGLGTLTFDEASSGTATSMAVVNGSYVTLDSTSSLTLGTEAAVAGAVAVGPDGLLVGDIGTVAVDVVDDGTLDVVDWSGGTRTDPGDFLIGGSLSGAGSVTVSGTLEVGDASAFAGSVAIDKGGLLVLDSGDMASAAITPLGGTATIEVLGQALDTTAFVPTYDSVSGLLVFGDAGGTATLDVGLGHQLTDFSLSSTGTGTLVTEAPCFAAGTRIAAGHGEIAVEALRPGDHVRTLGGRLAPVRWVGWTRLDLRRHRRPWRAAPVRVAAHAIAPGLPRRDLLLSPDHALLLDGALVPARLLANGTSIARQDGLAAITYVHVELDRHDILLAEGVAAESYLDTGNRGLFANAAGPRPLHPDFAARPDVAALSVWAERAAAPLLLDGPRVAALRARLAARAATLGWRVGGDPALVLLADGAVLPTRIERGSLRATLPAGARDLRLRSRSFVPAEIDPGSTDRRRLGVAVAAVLLGGWPLAAEAFADGWHPRDRGPGAGWRWSCGDAALRLPALTRATTLEVRLAPVACRWPGPMPCAA